MGVSNTNKINGRLVSIILVVILLLSSLIPAISASQKNETSFSEKLTKIKDNIKDYIQQESKKLNQVGICGLFADSALSLYVKYGDQDAKTFDMNLFWSTYVDINDDGKNDIKARSMIYPSIVTPFALAINIKAKIQTLEGFDDLDKNSFLETKIRFERPGLLSPDKKGDQIAFGYSSAEGEKIPSSCDLTYRYLPHFLSFKDKPQHRLNIDIGEETKGADLDLIFDFHDYNGSKLVQKDEFKISYSPIADTEIIIQRQPGAIMEFERHRESNSKVDFILKHWKNGNTTYVYSNDIPEHVTLNLDFGRDGLVEFNTHGDVVSEIGFYDDPQNPSYNIFFSNLGGKAGFDWCRKLLKGNAKVDVYTDSADTGFNVELNGDEGGFADLEISSDKDYEASVEIDILNGFFKLYRSDSDLSVNLDAEIKNETLGSFFNTVSASFKISKDFASPFVITFNKLREGVVEVTLAGQSLDISDFYMEASSPLIGGDLSVTMDHLIKEKQGNITVNLSVDLADGNVSGFCGFKAEKGVNITNITIKYNHAVVFHRDSFVHSTTVIKNWPFSFNVSVEWHVHGDHGYILIHPASSATFGFDSSYWEEDDIVASIYGEIRFETTNKDFNISWQTIDGNLSFSIDGSALASLTGFHLWVKDKIDVSIPEISVAFQLNTYNKHGNLSLFLDETLLSCNITIDNINISDLFDITLKGSLNIVLDASASGTVDIAWNESGIKSINGDFGTDATGSIDITDFEFNYKELVSLSIDRFFVDGGLNVNFNSIEGNISLFADVDLTDVILSDLSLYASMSAPLGFSGDLDITFDGTGFINISFINNSIILNGAIYDDSDITINTLWFLVPSPPIEINLENFFITGSTTVLFSVDTSNDVPFIVNLQSESEANADIIYLGYPGVLQIFMYDFVGGGPDSGGFGVGLNTVTSQPVFYLNDTNVYIGNLQFWIAGFLLPVSNISFEGTARIEGFLDIAELSYVYLRGEIEEDTIISVENMNIPGFDTCDISLVLQPGEIDLVLQNNLDGFQGGAYVFGYSSSWLTLKIDDKEMVRLRGTLDLWVNLHQSDDGTISAVLDAKEASGAIVIADALRVAGELNAHIEFSLNIQENEGTTTYSDLNLNISGELSAVIQIKTNNSDWIPIYPFNTSGQVVLFGQAAGFMSAPDIITDLVVEVPYGGDNTNLTFEVWYAPPLGENSSTIGPFTYNVSFDDGTYYEFTTDDNRVITPAHQYYLGQYNASVTVTTSDQSIDPLQDDFSFNVIEGLPTYLEIVDKGPQEFTYYDVEDDGRFHTWFEVGNKGKDDYILEWEAIYKIEKYWPDFEEADPIFEPEDGVLAPGENTKVNFSFLPPTDYDEHAIKIGANNTNYSENGADKSEFYISIYKTLEMFPSENFLPSLNPGESINSSIWIWNKKNNEVLNWTISEYPNENYSFSSTEGSIPPGSAEIVHFTVTAPDEKGVDLGGEINVTDSDDPVFFYTSNVHVETKGQGSGDGDVTVSEDENGNVSIAIGGSNEIHVNNFVFNINGVSGELDGHFIFDTNDSFVFINFTQGNFLQTFSVEGSAEFTIQNFRFCYGENISINVSKVITGGINWREGRSGNFSVAIDDTFTNVDIDLCFDYNSTYFVLSGGLDIDITNNMNGTLFIDWDFNGEDKHIDIDSDLFAQKAISVSLTNIFFSVNNFVFSADEISFDRKLNFSFNDTKLYIESSTEINADNINFEINNDFEIILADGDITIDGNILFELEAYNDGFRLYVNTTGLEMNGKIHVYYNEYYGSITIFFKMVGEFWIILELT